MAIELHTTRQHDKETGDRNLDSPQILPTEAQRNFQLARMADHPKSPPCIWR